jgi:hypothetical protein
LIKKNGRKELIFCSKLINVAVPKTIDERAINLNLTKQDIFRQSENLELGKKKNKCFFFFFNFLF